MRSVPREGVECRPFALKQAGAGRDASESSPVQQVLRAREQLILKVLTTAAGCSLVYLAQDEQRTAQYYAGPRGEAAVYRYSHEKMRVRRKELEDERDKIT